VPQDQRAAARLAAAAEAGRAWLDRQGEQHGFRPTATIATDGYQRIRLPRDGQPAIVFGQLDIEGVLDVIDPACFLTALARGFGRARAFGCGLMLIRRAR
jgi:CRISPR system Cascade subunit CasE